MIELETEAEIEESSVTGILGLFKNSEERDEAIEGFFEDIAEEVMTAIGTDHYAKVKVIITTSKTRPLRGLFE